MFNVDKKEIGLYLADLIHKSRFTSARQFGIAYLNLRYGYVDQDAIPNIQNRISQITNGNKWIQIEDLPIFAELLDVSVEDIVSAGTSSAASSSRVTNYSIAHSDDASVWEAYIQRKDKLILNPDEYNKTVIDYALEASNYAFLKYLMSKKLIWFVGKNPAEYHTNFGEYGAGFGAGTDIKRRGVGDIDILDTWLKDKDDLRFKMMSLAVKNKDFDMLDRLHAREIPLLYTISHFITHNPMENELPFSKNTERFTKDLASCPSTPLAYFFEPFTIESAIVAEKNTFFFPYAGVLLDCMIRQREKRVSLFIEKAARYNQDVLDKLNKAIAECIETGSRYYESLNCPELYDESFIKSEALSGFYFYPNTGFLSFTSARFSKNAADKGFITNIVRITARSSDPELQFLIDKLNETYETMTKIYTEKENKHV